MLKDGTYYSTLQGTTLARGTRNIAERIQAAEPLIPDNVAVVAALALSAEALIGTSVLNELRKDLNDVDDTLNQVTQNFAIGIQSAAFGAGLSPTQFRQLLKTAEQATIADLEDFKARREAGRSSGEAVH